jgi:uncharacterized membrane protein YkoI
MRMTIGRKAVAAGAAVSAIAFGVAGIATASGTGHSSASASAAPSRMDDGKDLLSQAKISESEAIAAAQGAASGDLNEVDLEHASGRLVYNVDVGGTDVQVDAATGKVVSSQTGE